MSQYVSVQLRREVRQRAGQHCEYCLLHEDDSLLPHEPDHIIAVKHGGETSAENRAWTRFLCNRAKGSDLASIDPPPKAPVPKPEALKSAPIPVPVSLDNRVPLPGSLITRE